MSEAPSLKGSVDLPLSTMFVLHLAFVLVSLLSFSTAALTTDDCSQLIQPLTGNELNQILGRWILIEGFANNELFGSMLENMESVWMMLNTTGHNQTLLLDQANRLVPQQAAPRNDKCLRFAQNVTLIDGKDLEIYFAVSLSNHRFLKTCPDCLLMHTYHKSNDYQILYLLGTNTTVPDSDLKTFRKQAACLQFSQPAKFHYNTNKELCPV